MINETLNNETSFLELKTGRYGRMGSTAHPLEQAIREV